MPLVTYIDTNKVKISIEVPSGLSVMHGTAKNMIEGIMAEYGQAWNCATCHCNFDDTWIDIKGRASGRKKQKLDQVKELKSNSRLSCQITIDEQLDGLIVYFPESQVWNDV